MWRQEKLRKTCGDHKIHVSAYSPLGGPGNAWGSTAVVNHPIIKSIALKHSATPAQVKLNSKLNHHISLTCEFCSWWNENLLYMVDLIYFWF